MKRHFFKEDMQMTNKHMKICSTPEVMKKCKARPSKMLFHLHQASYYKKDRQAWPLWVSWLGVVLQTERSQVQFPVRAQAWVAGSVPGQSACRRQLIGVSLLHWCFSPSFSPSLPLSRISKRKHNFIKLVTRVDVHVENWTPLSLLGWM